MKVLFHVGEYRDWYVLKREIVEYDNFPMDTLPPVGSRVIPTEAIMAKIKRHQSWLGIDFDCDFVRRIDVTPLGPVVILGADPSCITASVYNLDNNKGHISLFRVLPRVGDTIDDYKINQPGNSGQMYVRYIRFFDSRISIFVSSARPGITAATDSSKNNADIADRLLRGTLNVHVTNDNLRTHVTNSSIDVSVNKPVNTVISDQKGRLGVTLDNESYQLLKKAVEHLKMIEKLMP